MSTTPIGSPEKRDATPTNSAAIGAGGDDVPSLDLARSTWMPVKVPLQRTEKPVSGREVGGGAGVAGDGRDAPLRVQRAPQRDHLVAANGSLGML